MCTGAPASRLSRRRCARCVRARSCSTSAALTAASASGANPFAAVTAALSEHERARTQRSHVRRLKREAGAPVHTLPFLFDAEVGLEKYGTLAAKLARDLG